MNISPKVKVRLFNQAIPRELQVDIPDRFTIKDLIDQISRDVLRDGAEGAITKATDREGLMVIINGIPIQQLEGWKTQLSPNDEISIMVMMGGG